MTTKHRSEILQPKPGAIPIYLPIFSDKVAAGFPSPADDYIDGLLSLDEELIFNKTATYFVRARGLSMIGAGIGDGDMLVVDRSLSPASGDIVIAMVDGEVTVKRFVQNGAVVSLMPANPLFRELEFKDEQILEIWGVVTSMVKKFKYRNVKKD
jgi:DNA polymerase V